MELVTGFSNPSRIQALSRTAVREAESVDAAVAYITDVDKLIKDCFDLDVRLNIWARYGCEQPVAVPVLEKFLKKRSPNFVLKLVPDIFHPKVIWWRGYGAYIGSANMTKAAWSGNIEAGVFFTEDDLDEHGMREGLEDFFFQVDERSHPLTKEILDEVDRFSFQDPYHGRQQVEAETRFADERIIPKLSSLIAIDRKPKDQRGREGFLAEWNSTIETLRTIAQRVAEHRPAWVNSDVAPGAEADQFLHAYYYQQVVDEGNRNSHPFRAFYQENKSNPEAALRRALGWWKNLPSAPEHEDEMLHSWSPMLRDLLSQSRLLRLTEGDFADVCLRVHAMRNHAMRVHWRSFGLTEPLPTMDMAERVKYFARWLYGQSSRSGKSAREVIYHVLYKGPQSQIPTRLYEACFTEELKVRHLSVSSLGEMVGWALPDYSPPRNGRTSKALVALGNNVKVYGDSDSGRA